MNSIPASKLAALGVALAVTATFAPALNAAEIEKLVAAKITRPPTLDGKAHDAAWQTAKPVEVVAKGVMPKTRGTSAMAIDENTVRRIAIVDPDLEPLWRGMRDTTWKKAI